MSRASATAHSFSPNDVSTFLWSIASLRKLPSRDLVSHNMSILTLLLHSDDVTVFSLRNPQLNLLQKRFEEISEQCMHGSIGEIFWSFAILKVLPPPSNPFSSSAEKNIPCCLHCEQR